MNSSTRVGPSIYEAMKKQNMGEFGGSIIFSDKKSDLNYFLECTDSQMVDYRDGHYYVIIQLCNFDFGRTRILKIKDPTSLIKLRDNELPRRQIQRDSISNANSDLIKKLNKEIVLIDTANVSASVFFPYQGREYLIYSAKKEYYVQFDELDTTFLGEVRNGSLITLDTILNEPTWTAEFEPNKIVNGIYLYKYGVDVLDGDGSHIIDFKGRIFVKDDTIVIGYKNKDLRN